MSIERLLPPLRHVPRDVRGPYAGEVNEAPDEVVYRLGLHVLDVPGLPEAVRINDVNVSFVRGPVRAQITHIRQRHGLPVTFDKHMERPLVAEGERVAILAVREEPVPEDLEGSFLRWRARALAAAGMLAAVLDERVVGQQLFEDAVLLRNGAFVGAADMRGRVRTYLPVEVTAADRFALDQLASVSLSERSAVARAARLYRRAALEGPTADAYAMLWVAAECFSDRRSPSRKEIEQALGSAGIDPGSLPLSVGRLIGLRGKIQHHGLEDDDQLGLAFYEMEAVVRALIRAALKLRGGWWPAPENPSAFAEPFDAAVAALQGPGTSEWHPDGLPPALEPTPHGLPRRVANPAADPRLTIDPALGEAKDLVASVVVDALEWQDPNATLEITADLRPDAPAGTTMSADADAIRLSPARLEGVTDPAHPERIVNLVWDIHCLVGAALAQRAGLVSEGDGTVAIEAVGAWHQYRRLIVHGEFDAALLNIPTDPGPISRGKIAGWAAAGDRRAEAAASRLRGRDRGFVSALIDGLREEAPGVSADVLVLARRAARGSGTSDY